MNQELPSTAPNEHPARGLVVRASSVEDGERDRKSGIYQLLAESLTACLQSEGGLGVGPATATARRLVDAIAPIWGGQHVYFPKFDEMGSWLVGVDAMDPDWSALRSAPTDDSLDAVVRRCIDRAEPPRPKLSAQQTVWLRALEALCASDSFTPASLAIRLQLSKAKVFAALWDFEDFEWVIRERVSDERGSSALALTEKGHAALKKLRNSTEMATALRPTQAGEKSPSVNVLNRIAFYGDMGRRAMRILTDECLLDAERARTTARAMNIEIGSVLAGNHVYFCRDDKLTNKQRNEEIYARMQEGNAHDLGREYGLSFVRIYQIVRELEKKKRLLMGDSSGLKVEGAEVAPKAAPDLTEGEKMRARWRAMNTTPSRKKNA